MPTNFSAADRQLARRLEAGHARSGMSSAASHSVLEVAGGFAIFQGIDSPLTQALSIGMNGPVTSAELDRLERFYFDRSSPAVIDLCALADPGLLAQLQQRGYVVREISNVLVRDLRPTAETTGVPDFVIETVAPDQMIPWARLVVKGFTGMDDAPDDLIAMFTGDQPDSEAYFGVYKGENVATAAMELSDRLVTLYGDVTLEPARGKGIQVQMIHHRLTRAKELGCDLASASVMPGSGSHRNYERAGFQFVYSRVMLARG